MLVLSLIEPTDLCCTLIHALTNDDMKCDASMYVVGEGCDFGTAPSCEKESDLFCTGE